MPNTYRKVYPGIRSGGFETMSALDNFMTGVNAYLDAATGNWYRIDESKAAWGLVISVTNGCKVYWAGPGTGAISWTEVLSLDNSGILSTTLIKGLSTTLIKGIITYSQATEPDIDTDTVALWEDTTNNKYWFIWDRGGTQRKVELT